MKRTKTADALYARGTDLFTRAITDLEEAADAYALDHGAFKTVADEYATKAEVAAKNADKASDLAERLRDFLSP